METLFEALTLIALPEIIAVCRIKSFVIKPTFPELETVVLLKFDVLVTLLVNPLVEAIFEPVTLKLFAVIFVCPETVALRF